MIGVNQLQDIWVILGVSKMDTYPCSVFLMASRFKRNGFGTHVQTRRYILCLFGRFLHLTLSNFNMEPEKLGSMLIIASCWKMFSLISQIQSLLGRGTSTRNGSTSVISVTFFFGRLLGKAFRKGHHWAIT